MTNEVIAGTRPIGSCRPDGTHQWATRHSDDNLHIFTTYNGWLIDTETKTDSSDMAAHIEMLIVERLNHVV